MTYWELSLKYGLGKLELNGVEPDAFPEAAAAMGFETLPLDPGAAAGFHRLPRQSHRDPFDRLLVWQAIRSDCVLVTRDADLSH